MSSTIEFLEAAGRNPAVSTAEYAAAVAVLDVDACQKQALLHRDTVALNALLSGRKRIFCLIATPESEEPHPEEEVPGSVPGADQPPLQS